MDVVMTGNDLLQRLDESITDTAVYVFERICHWELPRLRNHNPSFDKIAVQARVIASSIKEAENGHCPAGFEELVEILESIAQSIADDDNALLIDCVAHLQTFLELRGVMGR